MRAFIWALLLPTCFAHLLVQLANTTSIHKFLRKYPTVDAHITKTFSFGNFHGFSGNFDMKMVKMLTANADVANISPDVPVKIGEADDLPRLAGLADLATVAVQDEAPRHLWRVSQRAKLDGVGGAYHHVIEGQHEIDVYVIDTGIYAGHPDFENRVQQGVDLTGEGAGDHNGHGTHVAGLIGSKTYGSAKNVSLVEVKVLTGLGTGNLSAVIAGIDYAVNSRRRSGRKSIGNLSLGAGFNGLLNSAVNAAVDSGLPMVVAAGNGNTAACSSSPASSTKAITVGAIDDRYDTIASFSNWGSCIDLFASGVYVTSLSHTGHTLALSGTSMAAPVVAGMMAMYMGLGEEEMGAGPRVIKMATANAIDFRSILFRPRTPNLIAFNGLGADNAPEYKKPSPEELEQRYDDDRWIDWKRFKPPFPPR